MRMRVSRRGTPLVVPAPYLSFRAKPRNLSGDAPSRTIVLPAPLGGTPPKARAPAVWRGLFHVTLLAAPLPLGEGPALQRAVRGPYGASVPGVFDHTQYPMPFSISFFVMGLSSSSVPITVSLLGTVLTHRLAVVSYVYATRHSMLLR